MVGAEDLYGKIEMVAPVSTRKSFPVSSSRRKMLVGMGPEGESLSSAPRHSRFPRRSRRYMGFLENACTL